MRLGIPTLIEFNSVEQHLRFASEHGFDFVEINLSFPWYQSNRLDVEQLVTLSKRYGVDYTIHLHDQVNPFDFSPEMRNGSLASVEYALHLAKSVGSKRLTMHLIDGMYASSNGKKIYGYAIAKDQYLSHVATFIDLCKDALKESDAFFCIENTKGYLSFQEDAIDLMLKEDCFGLTFDVGHNYRAGGGDEVFILERRERIKHFHTHDVREVGNHFALGSGVLDIPRYVGIANELDCSQVIEVKESSAVLESLDYLTEIGY
jgi:sugar phosphate isomerase/epimerase